MADKPKNTGRFGDGRKGGRPKGTPNRVTREFKEVIESILFDNPEETREKLLDLRDSEDASDRKTFWAMSMKLMPQKVEGKIDVGLPKLILEQDYVNGQTREIKEEDEG